MQMVKIVKQIESCKNCKKESFGYNVCKHHQELAEQQIMRETRNILNKFERSNSQCNQ